MLNDKQFPIGKTIEAKTDIGRALTRHAIQQSSADTLAYVKVSAGDLFEGKLNDFGRFRFHQVSLRSCLETAFSE